MATVVTGSPSHLAATEPSEARGMGILRRAFRSLIEARQRKADSEIAEILARRGGAMRDELEAAPHRNGRTYPFTPMPGMSGSRMSGVRPSGDK